MPPSKRPNFIKLGIVTPFHCPWRILLNDWNPEINPSDFFVLRNMSKVNILRQACKKSNNLREQNVFKSMFSQVELSSCLVQVCVKICGRGVLGECSPICLPSKHDLKTLRSNKHYRGPVEPNHEDVFESQRKTLRAEHLAMLKRLRKKRVKAKRQLQENEEASPETDKTKKLSPCLLYTSRRPEY